MEENKLVLPAIAVRGIVPLPNNEFRIEVGRENSVLALDAAEKMYGGNVLLLIQKDANIVDVQPSDIEKRTDGTVDLCYRRRHERRKCDESIW